MTQRAVGPAGLLMIAGLLTGCASGGTGPAATSSPDAPRVVQPGAPGQPSREFPGALLDQIEGASYTEADVRFMQGMIHHHAQALQMTALIPDRTNDRTMHQLGQRISISQRDEIRMMQSWLRQRGHEAPSGNPEGPLMMMHGMLTGAQMQALRDAEGVGFERLFLQGMIQHHGGAIVMVQELFNTPAAGQETTINFFANEVDSDQTIEVQRMQQMLAERR